MQTNSSVFLGDQYYNKQHLDFILFKVLKADSLTAFDYFSEHDKDAIKIHEHLMAFEDSTSKARMALAKKYNTKYHPPYFTKIVPEAKKEK